MATKTLTFQFKKKVTFKFDKEFNHTNKSGKKKILGLQSMSFYAKEAYHIAPVKIVKNELSVLQKGINIEVEGSLKFKVGVKDQFKSNFDKSIKDKTVELHYFGFNTDPTPGVEITLFKFPNPLKTKDLIDIS